MTGSDITLVFTPYTLKRSESLKLYIGRNCEGFAISVVYSVVTERLQPNGKMASSYHLESGLETVVAIFCILSGIVFPLGATCSVEYNAIVVNNLGR